MISTFQGWRFQRWRQASLWTTKKIRRQRIRGILEEDQSQTQKELAESLGGNSTSHFCTIKSHGNDSKTRKLGALWTETERRWKAIFHLRTADSKTEVFCIVTGDEKWIFYDNPKKKKYYAKPGQSLPSTSTSTRLNIHDSKIMLWWDQKGLVYYELLKPGDSITGDRLRRYNWFVWTVHCEKNDRNTRHDKIILLHDNARPYVTKVVKKYLETLKWDVLPHPPYSPDITPSDYWLFQRMQQVLLSQKSKIGSKIGSPPKTSHFFEMKFENCLRDGKK